MSKYYYLNSPIFGQGPLHETREGVEEEIDDAFDGEDRKGITIHEIEISKKEYEALPEHPGY